MMQQALDLYTSTMDESSTLGYTKVHPKYASMLAIMGLMLRDLDRLKEAKKMLEKALHIQEKILSQQNLMKAETICSLGTVLHRLGERPKALKTLNTALSTMTSVKYNHPITATVSAAIGRLLLDTGELFSAKVSVEDALKIHVNCTGSEIHPSVALYHELLAQIAHTNQDDHVLARDHLHLACRTYRSLYEREERVSRESGIQLPVLEVWRKKVEDLQIQLKKFDL